MNLRGYNLVNLDSKGRIIMPAEYRAELQNFCDSKLVLSRHPYGDRCLVLYPLPSWQKVESQINQLPSHNPEVRALKRIFIGLSANIKVDKNNRMVIPVDMREQYNLHKEIVLVGAGTSFELWDKSLWDKEGLNTESLGESPTEMVKGIVF